MLQRRAMESLTESIIDFIKVRQLNIAVLVLLTVVYVAYQYREVLFKNPCEDPIAGRSSRRLSRSKSRSRSRSRPRSPSYREYKPADSKHGRRGRNVKRCPDCNKYNCESYG